MNLRLSPAATASSQHDILPTKMLDHSPSIVHLLLRSDASWSLFSIVGVVWGAEYKFVMAKLIRTGVGELELAALRNVVRRTLLEGVASTLLSLTRCNLSSLLVTNRRPELSQKRWTSLSERLEEVDRSSPEHDELLEFFDAATRKPLCVIYVLFKPLRC